LASGHPCERINGEKKVCDDLGEGREKSAEASEPTRSDTSLAEGAICTKCEVGKEVGEKKGKRGR